MGESDKAFQAFTTYLEMGEDRSIRAVARSLGKSKTLMDRWSGQWRWVERVGAWQGHQAAEARRAELKAVREMRQRHAQEAVLMQRKALDRLGQMNPLEMTPNDVLRFFVEAAKLERVSRGEPETITHQEHTGKDGGPIAVAQVGDLTRLTPEELDELERLVSKTASPGDDSGGEGEA